MVCSNCGKCITHFLWKCFFFFYEMHTHNKTFHSFTSWEQTCFAHLQYKLFITHFPHPLHEVNQITNQITLSFIISSLAVTRKALGTCQVLSGVRPFNYHTSLLHPYLSPTLPPSRPAWPLSLSIILSANESARRV